jgi:hypothetical protein
MRPALPSGYPTSWLASLKKIRVRLESENDQEETETISNGPHVERGAPNVERRTLFLLDTGAAVAAPLGKRFTVVRCNEKKGHLTVVWRASSTVIGAHAVDWPRYRIQFAERSLGTDSGGNGPSRSRGGSARLGQVPPCPDPHSACAGQVQRCVLGHGDFHGGVGRSRLSGNRMALLTTFPEHGVTPDLRLSGATARSRMRAFSDSAYRSVGAAFGGI